MGLLDGKVAIVTGASRGIGAEIARRFAAEGAAVAVAARTTEPGVSQFDGTIAETAGQIRAAGGTAVAIPVLSDVTDASGGHTHYAWVTPTCAVPLTCTEMQSITDPLGHVT